MPLKDKYFFFNFLEFKIIEAAFAKLRKSKYLVVCKGNFLNKGIKTEVISSNLDIKNKAESLFLFTSTLPTPKALAILCSTSTSSL